MLFDFLLSLYGIGALLSVGLFLRMSNPEEKRIAIMLAFFWPLILAMIVIKSLDFRGRWNGTHKN